MATPSSYVPLQIILDDENNPLWEAYQIEIVPTVLFFASGQVVKRLDGQPGIGLGEADLRKALSAGTTPPLGLSWPATP